MTVYAIRNDGYRYQEFDLEIDDILRECPKKIDYEKAHDFSPSNLAMASWWPSINASFRPIEGEDHQPIPDICKWIDATLVLSPKAYRLLGDTLTVWGEFLPVKVNDATFYIFNCLTNVSLDENASEKEIFDGIVMGYKSIAFPKNAVEKLVFKCPEQNCLDAFSNRQFKAIAEEYELTGILFDENLVREF